MTAFLCALYSANVHDLVGFLCALEIAHHHALVGLQVRDMYWGYTPDPLLTELVSLLDFLGKLVRPRWLCC